MSTVITMGEVTELTDPQLRKIAKRVAKEMALAIEKVVAHQAEPANFPFCRWPWPRTDKPSLSF